MFLLYWHGFCDVSVTLYNVNVTLSPALSKKILDVHPWSDSTEFRGIGEAVPIGCFNLIVFLVLFSCCCSELFPRGVMGWSVTFPDHTYLPLIKGHYSVAAG